jgi:hypothetical protein
LSLQDSGARGALTDLPSELRGQPRGRWPAHQTQDTLDALFGDKAQKWGLLKLHRQALPQGTVEDRIAGCSGSLGPWRFAGGSNGCASKASSRLEARERNMSRHTRATTVVSHPPRFSMAAASERLSRSQAS